VSANPGATHTHPLPPLEQLASELGYTLDRRPLDGPADGWCDSRESEIVINDALPANAQVRVLVHEIAHALGMGYRDYGCRQAEVLVDTVTFIVCGSVGLDVSGSSVPYLEGLSKWRGVGWGLESLGCVPEDWRSWRCLPGSRYLTSCGPRLSR
jgi:hypothetical protein